MVFDVSLAQIKRSVDMLRTLHSGTADADTQHEREAWQVIAMRMLDGEVRNLETVNWDLQERFDLGKYAGFLYV